MKVLVLGASRIACTRVLPALGALPMVSGVEIASRGNGAAQATSEIRRLRVFDCYEDALSRSSADLVYVSLINSLHFEWASRALQSGRHVIVDKPATLTLAQSEQLLDVAARRALCLAEATVFSFHPRVDRVRELVASLPPGSARVSATFSFPPLPAGDFRNSREAGGGALSDLGPYVAATARLVFGQPAEKICCQILSSRGGVETAFAVLMQFAEGGALVGRFGFDTEYVNHVSVAAPGLALDFERAYSIPAGLESQIHVRQRDSKSVQAFAPSDVFQNFIRQFLAAAACGDHGSFADALLADAQLVSKLRTAARSASFS